MNLIMLIYNLDSKVSAILTLLKPKIGFVVFMVFLTTTPLLAFELSPTVHLHPSPISLAPLVTSGLENPIFITHAGDQSFRLFVVEQPGRIRIIQEGILLSRPFLDMTSKVGFGGERGLLGLAFHPNFRRNGRFVVNYTRSEDGATVIAELTVSDNPNQSSSTERILLTIPQPYGNHNGGMVAFGPDGFLYIGTGDGGSGGDPGNRGQDPSQLLGKVLRLDTDHGSPYDSPSTNPFFEDQGRAEIYALGFRNPWRFSFDRETGELWVGDVGQNQWEEIDLVERGKNYGWRIMEGAHCYAPPKGCSQLGLSLPVAEYKNESPRCAITGGYVYRGNKIPALRGTYIFGDYCSGEIMGLTNKAPKVLANTGLRITSFGENEEGEIYVVDHGGTISRLAPSSVRP